MADAAIVGGGVLGLTLALRLATAGRRVVVLEGAAAPGGLAAPHRIGDFTWDRFYHVMLESDRHLAGLLDELALGSRVQWGTTRTGFFTDGRFHSMSDSWEFLRFPPLGLVDKGRLAATILRAAKISDGAPLETIPVEDWLRRWSGDRTFRRIWQPLLEAKLGENWRRASAAFIWAIISRMYAARRSGLKRERFGYVGGGYDTVLTALRRRLETLGVEVRSGQAVREVRDVGDRASLHLADGSEVTAKAAVLTLAATRIPQLVPQLSAEERARLGRVVYQGVICASLLLDRPLAGFYVTNITDGGFPFTALIEMTALVDRANFGGLTLAYLPRYCTAEDPWWGLSDDEVRARFLEGLTRLFPGFDSASVKALVISRAREVQALPTLHYSRDALPGTRTSLPRLFIVNSAQIVNGTLNTNESVGLANAKSAELLRLLPTG